MLDPSEIEELFPVASGDITLRLFNLGDINDRYVNWLNDPEVVKYSNQRFKKHTVGTCVDYFHSFADSEGIFLAIIASTGLMLGTVTIYCDSQHETADIGLMIGDTMQWGKGYGARAWGVVLNLLSHDACVRKVTGGTLDCNYGMIKIMRGSGMQEDGVRRAQNIINGRAHDVLYFCVLR